MTELKEKYPYIRRIAYLCKHESGSLVGAGTSLKQKIKDFTGRDEYVAEYEEIKKIGRVNSAGRASYVERNQWMIDDSDFCLFYLKNSNKKSGTQIAYIYAEGRKWVKVL